MSTPSTSPPSVIELLCMSNLLPYACDDCLLMIRKVGHKSNSIGTTQDGINGT